MESNLRIANLITIIFSLISLIFTYQACASEQSFQYSQDVIHGIPFNEIEKQLVEIRESSTLNTTEKISKILNKLQELRPYATEPQFFSLFSNVENLLLETPDDVNVKFIQLGFLSMLANSNLWPYSLSREEFVANFIKIAESENTNQQFPASTKLFIRFVEMPYLLQATKYEELDAQIEDSYALVQGDALWGEFRSQGNLLSKTLLRAFVDNGHKKLKKTFLSVLRAIDLRSQIDRGNVVKIVEQGDLLDADFKDVSEIISTYPNLSGADGLGFLGVFLLADEYLGKDQNLIEKADYILKKYPKDVKQLNQFQFKSDLYRKISTAYGRLGNKELADKNRQQANEFLIKSGYVDTRLYANEFTHLMDMGDYKNARHLIDALEKYYLNTKQNNFEVFSDYIKIMRVYNNTALDKGFIKGEDIKTYFMNGALLLEAVYFKSLGDGEQSIQDDLATFEALNNAYYRAGDFYYAAFYAKRYVNTLQKLRSDVNAVNYKYVTSFTEKHEESLKRFANNFYEVGDVDAAIQCLQIIKENRFFDYVRRSNLPENFLSLLSNSSEENDFFIRLDTLSSEIKALQGILVKRSTPIAEIELIATTLGRKKNELHQTKLDLDAYMRKSATLAKKVMGKPLLSTTNLKTNEVALYIDILPDEVFSYLTLPDKSVQRFSFKIDSLQIRTLILDVNLALSKNNSIPKDKLAKLSEILISQPMNFILEKDIRTLKLRVGDFVGFVPANILQFKGRYLGDLYVLEMQGLGKSKHFDDTSLKNMNAFGATQGNSEFSKLPAVKAEIASLMQLPVSQEIKSRKSYIDMDFTKASLMSSFKDGIELIHIATHFKASGNTAGSAKMLLGDGNTISLQDINNDLPILNTSLLTLSACDTGSIIPMNKPSNKTTSTFYEGLSNAFQIKGAKNVISTLWSVSDQATADFMEAYYLILFNNKISPSEALHYTQNIFRHGTLDVLPSFISINSDKQKLGFLKNIKDYTHPYFWGAFQISTIN